LQNRGPSPSLKQHGFTYTEVLLSAVLLAVLLVPALQALQTGIAGGATSAMAARPPLLRAKMEEVLANPFPELYAETYPKVGTTTCNTTSTICNTTTSVSVTYSDSAGATDRRVVVLYRYDPSATPPERWSGNDTGLLYVSVYYEAEGSANALTTLAGRWW
jgi:Tfp pilus assembly protein PilE